MRTDRWPFTLPHLVSFGKLTPMTTKPQSRPFQLCDIVCAPHPHTHDVVATMEPGA